MNARNKLFIIVFNFFVDEEKEQKS